MTVPGILFLLALSFSLCKASPPGILATVTMYDDVYSSPQIKPQNNYGGWVNPEDLPPMPQCIAQQDPAAWLEVMTRCISKGCTRHFGIICTHHQWLARLDCLRTDFTADIVGQYFSLCSRSILAKAQLFSWINTITGRTWLVEAGDSLEVHTISPHSLRKGYMDYDVFKEAPSCLRASSSSPTTEGFQHIASSCTFTGRTKHTGNIARPWEYNERARSMVALDFETAGYDMTHSEILDGLYIDKECLCTSYTIDINREPCKSPTQTLDQTRERLWMMATCGFRSIPYTWTQNLRTIGDAFILIEDWTWPEVISSTPRRAKLLVERCSTDACELDERGYCRTQPAVEKACICRNITYTTCGKLCEAFETRISYVNWLHQLCGTVDGWHGLPKDWKRLAQPSSLKMIPWHWPVIKSEDANLVPHKTLVLLNFLATIIIFGGDMVGPRVTRGFPSCLLPQHWLLRGISIAAIQLLAYLVNALVIRSTPGYAGTSILEMVLLWCSLPRIAWLPVLLIGIQPMERVDLIAAASASWAEVLLQALSSYHLLMTIIYGFEHSFYFSRLLDVDKGGSALLMYWGALMWLIVVGLTILQCTRIDSVSLRRWHRVDWSSKSLDRGHMIWLTERCAWIDEQFAHHYMGRFKGIYRPHSQSYGSINNVLGLPTIDPATTSSLYVLVMTSMILLWASQLLFWFGLIDVMLAVEQPIRLV